MVATVRRSRRWSRLLVRSGVIAGFGIGLWCAGAATAAASELPVAGDVSSAVQEVTDALPVQAPEVLSLPAPGSGSDSDSDGAEPAPVEPEPAETGGQDSVSEAGAWVSDTADDIASPAADLVPDQVVEPVAELSKPVIEDVVEPVAEPVSEITEPVVQDVVEPVSEITEPVGQDVVEPVTEPVVQDVSPD